MSLEAKRTPMAINCGRCRKDNRNQMKIYAHGIRFLGSCISFVIGGFSSINFTYYIGASGNYIMLLAYSINTFYIHKRIDFITINGRMPHKKKISVNFFILNIAALVL